MKNNILLTTLALLACFFLQSHLQAQAPQGITYQAVARDNNALLTNQTFDVQFTILDGGTPIYQEQHTVTSNDYGLFTAIVGDGLPVLGDFATIPWGTSLTSLRVEINNGSGYVNMGVNRLYTVPYSFYSDKAGTVENLDFSLGDLNDVNVPFPATGEVLKWDGTQWVSSPDGGGDYIAGAGITISNDSIINTGDFDPTDDIMIGTPAMGDLSGTYPAPSVTGIQNRDVSIQVPTDGDVLKWNITTMEWEPKSDNVTTGGGVNATGRLSGDGSISNPLDIAQQGATNGQVLKWNGTSWSPKNDSVNTQTLSVTGNLLTITSGNTVTLPGANYSAGPGIDISGNIITNTGDINEADDITVGSPAGGDLSGFYPNPGVARIRGNTIANAIPLSGQVLKYSGTQWEPLPDLIDDPDNDPSNEIQVLSLSGSNLSLSNGGGAVNLPVYTGGTGIDVIGSVIINTGDTNAADDITVSTLANGDLVGTYANPLVAGIWGRPISNATPNNGEVYKWNQTAMQWQLSDDEVNDLDSNPVNELQSLSINGGDITLSNGGGTVTVPAPPAYTGGAGIDVSGTIITNTGDLVESDDINIGDAAGGDLGGTFPNPDVLAIAGNPVANAAPATGQVLKWNGAQWAPATDDDEDGDILSTNELQSLTLSGNTLSLSLGGGNVNIPVYTGGAGIDVLGTTIINTGDLDGTDDLLIGSLAGGDLGGTFPNPNVIALNGNPISNNMPGAPDEVLKWNGSQWEPGQDEIDDADASPVNELQELDLVGNDLSLTLNGGTVTLPSLSPGTGIDITGNVISNTGDLNGADDLLIGSPASGDLTGAFPSPEIASLQGNTLSAAAPTANQILKYNGSGWVLSNDVNTTYVGGTGISLSGNVINNTGDIDPLDDITTSSTASGDLSGTFPTLTLSNIQGQPVVAAAPTIDQVLKFNGTAWVPDSDANDTYTAGTAISIVGNAINNTGDPDASDDITTSTSASGDISGTFPTLTLSSIQGQAISVGAATSGQVLKYNGTGWVPADDDFLSSSLAGGDLTGTYPNPTIGNLQGNPIVAGTPSAGEVLKYNGSAWVPDADENDVYTAGTAISIVGNAINNTGDTNPLDDITTSTSATGDLSGTFPTLTLSSIQGVAVNAPTPTAGYVLKYNGASWVPLPDDGLTGVAANGDLSGTYPNPTVDALQGTPVSGTAPTTIGQVLEFNGTTWVPGTDDNTTYTAGTAISISGTTINNTGDTNPADDITTSTGATGDLTGTYPAPTIANLQGNPVLAGSPTVGQLLGWNGSAWVPLTDANTTYNAGTGIAISGTTISNTGDVNAGDDITTSTGATGDLTGTYPAPTIANLQGNPVAASAPAVGQLLGWNGSAWIPLNDANTTYNAGTGINISGTTISNSGDLNAADDITTSTGAAGDLAGTYPAPTIASLQGNTLSASAPVSGQILKYNGTAWVPATDDGLTGVGAGGDLSGTYPNPTIGSLQGETVSAATPSNGQILKYNGSSWVLASDDNDNTTYSAGTGISLTGTTINNTGDLNAADDITTSTAAAGDVSGTFPSLTLSNIQGNPISAASPAANQILQYNGTTWVPVDEDGLTGAAASGDLSGTYPAPTIASLQGITVTAATPASGEVLKYNGTAWVPASDDGTTYTGGTGISVAGTVITNSGDTNAADDITTSTSALGDLTGTYPAPTIASLQGITVTATTPASGEVLKYNGTAWVPSSDDGTTYTGGTGISVAGTVITNSGDTNAADDITTSTSALGDLTGTYPAPTIASLQGVTVTAATPASGEVLKYNGTAWVPASDDGANYTGGTGISVSGTVITNSGDTNAADDITTSTSALGDLTGTYPAPTIASMQGVTVAASAPALGEVLKYNGTAWVPASDDGTTYTGGTGISVAGTVITNSGDTNAADDITTSTSALGDLTGTYPAPTIASLQGNTLAVNTPSAGDIIKYNGSVWTTSTDDTTTYIGGSGISISGSTITNSGDTNAGDDITTSTGASGDLTGTYPAPTIASIQGITVSASAPGLNQVLAYNGTGWVPAVDAVDDADNDISNEIQTLSISGTNLSLSNGGGAVTIPTNTYVGGTGIAISGLTILNTGDADASDDITTSTVATGDLTGTYPAPTIASLQGNVVNASGAVQNDVLQFDGTSWETVQDVDQDTTNEIQTISLTGNQLALTDGGTVTIPTSPPVYAAGVAIEITGANVINNLGDTDSTNDVTDTTPAGGDLTGIYPDPTIASIQGITVNAATPFSGEVMKYNGTAWQSAADINLVGSAAGGDLVGTYPNPTIGSIQGTTVLTSSLTSGQVLEYNGATWVNGTDNTLDGSAAGGDLTGTYPDPSISSLQGNTIIAGTPVADEILKYNGTNWVLSDDNSLDGATAGGDLIGSYPNPSLNNIQGNPLSASTPSANQVLEWSGTAWIPATDDSSVYVAGTGIAINNKTIVNLGDANASDDITTSTSAGGDLSGTYPDPTISSLQGDPLATSSPATGEVLKFIGGSWINSVDDSSVYVAGAGISITGKTITNAGDPSAADDITTSTTATGDLAGTYPAPTIASLQGNTLTASTPISGDVLKFVGGSWVNAVDDSSVYVAGAGISITGKTITNSGDTNAADDATLTTAATGDVTGDFTAGFVVEQIRGTNVVATAPVAGEYLRSDGTDWIPTSINSSDITVNSNMIPDTDQTYDLGSSTLAWNNVFTFNTVTVTSDIREKKEILPIEYGLKELMKLRPVSYEWKRSSADGVKLGFIAQEISPIISEVVATHEWRTNPETGKLEKIELDRYGVSYTELIPVIIKGMQEQQEMLDAQKDMIEQQQLLIQQLEERLEKVENNGK